MTRSGEAKMHISSGYARHFKSCLYKAWAKATNKNELLPRHRLGPACATTATTHRLGPLSVEESRRPLLADSVRSPPTHSADGNGLLP